MIATTFGTRTDTIVEVRVCERTGTVYVVADTDSTDTDSPPLIDLVCEYEYHPPAKKGKIDNRPWYLKYGKRGRY